MTPAETPRCARCGHTSDRHVKKGGPMYGPGGVVGSKPFGETGCMASSCHSGLAKSRCPAYVSPTSAVQEKDARIRELVGVINGLVRTSGDDKAKAEARRVLEGK